MGEMKSKLSILLALFLLIFTAGCGESPEAVKKARTPLVINVWSYYTSSTKDAFDSLVSEFNESVGKEYKITVKHETIGSLRELNHALMSSALGEAGSMRMPNLFISYKGVAKDVEKEIELIDFNEYFSKEEKEKYVDSFVELGKVEGGKRDRLIMLPFGTSTTVLMINETDFAPLEAAIGVGYEDLKTYEGLAKAAQKYYEYTDAKTPTKNDGLALFGLDSVPNYFFEALKQQGADLLSEKDGKVVANLSKEHARKIWDNYYVPMVKGHYGKYGKFSSEDIKIGKVLLSLCSTTSSTYFPDQKFVGDEAFDIDLKVLPSPKFEGSEGLFIVQGGGLIGAKKSKEEDEAAVMFAKWITASKNNSDFTITSSYLPVTKEGFDEAYVSKHTKEKGLSPKIEKTLICGFNQYKEKTSFYVEPLDGYEGVRSVIEKDFGDFAMNDAKEAWAKIQAGGDYEEVLKSYLSDEHFEEWYSKFIRDVNSILDDVNKG
ncbi:MAG: extracellular solute-binding protein [Bacillota bacterium]|nr:extracellular solute-binding protein [Bacillota bacterium]